MKKFILFFLLALPLQAQDTVRVIHGNYRAIFSTGKKYPVFVEWWVTKAKLECANPVKRQDKFIPDPTLKKESDVAEDYVGSGLDRGHLSPAADARCNARYMEESFFFTNMAPQYPGLNRGQWKNLEEWTRYLATENDSVLVRAGCVGEARRVRRLAVPTHCWKVITVKAKNETTAYVFPNVPEKSASFEMHMVPLDSVSRLSGFTFRR